MTAATITTAPSGHLASDDVVLTITNGETYVSKLSDPITIAWSWLEKPAGKPTAGTAYWTLSGRTFTFVADGITDEKVAVHIKGNL